MTYLNPGTHVQRRIANELGGGMDHMRMDNARDTQTDYITVATGTI